MNLIRNMSYIEFSKEELINLEYALSKEILRTNKAGSYINTSIINCNTRKCHGLLICPLDHLDGGAYVLLSSLDEVIEEKGGSKFRLGIHRYPNGVFHPAGHKYIEGFVFNPLPQLTFRVGGVKLTREGLLVNDDERILLKYTLEESDSPIKIQYHPFLAFRQVNALTRENIDIINKYQKIENGIKTKLYSPYPYLYMQFSKEVDFVAAPQWYHNIEYIEDQKRGHGFQEDLYVPGYFEMTLKKGETVVFSAGLKEIDPQSLKKLFKSQAEKRIPIVSFENCLKNAAHQFISRKGKKTKIIAGFPWFGYWTRDTFISLPGLTLALDDPKTCKEILDTMSEELRGSLFPNMGRKQDFSFNSIDSPLWYIWAIQQYAPNSTPEQIWKDYGKKIRAILEGFRKGTDFNIHMLKNGLLYGGVNDEAITWMDSKIDHKPVTPRIGCCVEINALWYNAIVFALELAKKNKDQKFVEDWQSIPDLTKKSFIENFWNEQKAYLADYIKDDYKDWAVRPNQMFAASLKYSMLDEEQQKSVLDKITYELLTPKGLRTLSPNHPDYKGTYGGDQVQRHSAYHQGTAWPWLLGPLCELHLKLHDKSGLEFVKRIYANFEEEVRLHGIGTISEVYDGDPPHLPNGAISQAWSIAELLRIRKMIENYQKK